MDFLGHALGISIYFPTLTVPGTRNNLLSLDAECTFPKVFANSIKHYMYLNKIIVLMLDAPNLKCVKILKPL